MESDETQEEPHPPEEASTEPAAGDAQPGQDQEATLSSTTPEQDEEATLPAEAEAATPAEEAATAAPAGSPSGPVTTLPPRSARRRVGFSLLAAVAALLVVLVVVTSVIASRQPPAASGAKTTATASPTTKPPHQVSVYAHTYTPTFQLGANGPGTPTTPVNSRVFALNGADGLVRWQYMLSNSIGTSQVATDDVLYVGINDGNVSAFDTSTGKQLWSTKLLQSSVVWQAVNGIVYATSSTAAQGNSPGQSGIYALDASSGKQLWQFAKASGIDLLASGILYASLGSGGFGYAPAPFTSLSRPTNAAGAAAESPGTIYALDATTGAERWHFQHAGGLSVQAVTGGQVVVAESQISVSGDFATMQSAIYALDASTGKQLWSYPKNTSDDVSLVGTENGMVYVYTRSSLVSFFAPPQPNTLTAVSAADGSVHWKKALPFRVIDASELPPPGTYIITRASGSGALLSNGVIYLGDDDPVSAYNASDGSLLWSNTKLWKNTIENSPALQMVANGIVYLAVAGSSSAKGLYALDASSGKLLWKQLGKNLFVGAVNNGVLYASSADYDLPPLPLTPKPLKSDDNVIMALDAETGIVHWVYGTGTEIADIIAQ